MDILLTFCGNFLDTFIDMSFYMMLGLLFVGVLNTYVQRDKILKHLGSDSFASVVKASLVGVPLPLCSCGVVPTAAGLKKNGASNGAVVSFLISTPQTGVDSIFATYSMMGWVMAIFRPIAAFCAGIIGGGIVNLVAKDDVINTGAVEGGCGCGCEHEHPTAHDEKAEEPCHCHAHVHEATSCACGTHEDTDCHCHEAEPCHCHETHAAHAQSACQCGTHEAHAHEAPHTHSVESTCGCGCGNSASSAKPLPKILRVFTHAYGSFLDEIAMHFLIGMLLAAAITTFLPADFFVSLGLHEGMVSMLAMVLIGLPMYICSTSSIPIAISLMSKGLSLGGAFVFLFTGPVTNVASILVLSKALGKKITTLYIGIVIACALVFGMALDFITGTFSLDVVRVSSSMMMHGGTPSVFELCIAACFAVLLLKGIVRNLLAKR